MREGVSCMDENELNQFMWGNEPEQTQRNLMFYGRFMLERTYAPEHTSETGLFVFEPKYYVRHLSEQPYTSLCVDMVVVGQVSLIIVLARIAGKPYECWVDLTREDSAMNVAGLAEQPALTVLLYTPDDPTEPTHHFRTQNELRPFFAALRADGILAHANWSRAEFMQARSILCRQYPTTDNLEQALRHCEIP